MALDTKCIKALMSTVCIHSTLIDTNFGNKINKSTKADGTSITAIDKQLNALYSAFTLKFPEIGFIGEEGNGDIDNKYLLYVDPLDGTDTFLRGIATCTSIATIMKKNEDGTGEPVYSIIVNPITREFWHAAKNTGANKFSVNNNKETILSVRNKPDRIETAICAWPGASHNLLNISKEIANDFRFSDQPMGALGIGGALIAQGTLDATACGTTSAVETAAMSLIVREAGGVTIDLNGDPILNFTLGTWKDKEDFLLPNGAIVASSQTVADELLSFIQENQNHK